MKLTKPKPRIRLFLGANTSEVLKKSVWPKLLGVYINSKEIEEKIRKFNFIDFAEFKIETSESEVLQYLSNSDQIFTEDLLREVKSLKFQDQKLDFSQAKIHPQFALAIANFILNKSLQNLHSISFEAPITESEKILLVEKADKLGYKIYLYFLAAKADKVCVKRVGYHRYTEVEKLRSPVHAEGVFRSRGWLSRLDNLSDFLYLISRIF